MEVGSSDWVVASDVADNRRSDEQGGSVDDHRSSEGARGRVQRDDKVG